MITDGDVLTKNKVKELLRNSTEPKTPKGKRRGRETFFVANIAIVALVALTAISYGPSSATIRAIDAVSEEDASATIERESASGEPIRYPLISTVKVVLESGNEFYLDERTAAMLGAIKLASVGTGEVALFLNGMTGRQ